jgi:hypothetical protein
LLLLVYFALFPVYFWYTASANPDVSGAMLIVICGFHGCVFFFMFLKIATFAKTRDGKLPRPVTADLRKIAKTLAEYHGWHLVVGTPKELIFHAPPPLFHNRQCIRVAHDHTRVTVEVHSFLTKSQLSPFTFFADNATRKKIHNRPNLFQ